MVSGTFDSSSGAAEVFWLRTGSVLRDIRKDEQACVSRC